jgi:hypothetical protein
MATQKVNIDISTRGAKKSKDELSGLNSAISKMGKAVGVASAAYFGAKGLINALSTVVVASGRQEQAEKALEVALGRTSTALLNQASALQKVTTAGDEAIIEQQAFLASLKFTEDQIKTIIPVALDLSAATGISLESAVRNTSKTFSGLAGELGELVPQLRELTTEEMKAGEAVKVLGELFEGQAAKQADTMSGALIQAQNSAGDLAEAIGEKLSPLVKALATDFSKTVDELTNLIKADDTEFIGPALTESQIAMQEFREEISKMSLEELFLEMEKIAGISKNLFDDEQQQLYNHQLVVLRQTIQPLIGDIKRAKDAEIDFGATIEKVNTKAIELEINKGKIKQENMKRDVRLAALSQKSAKDTMKAIVRAETMEAIAGYISSVLKSVPFPFNIVAAAGAGAVVSEVIDRNLAQFATGGDFITSGPQMIMVGDNPGGRERVQVTPLSSPNINGPQGVTINLQGNIFGTREFVRDTLIPEIQKAVRYS